MIYSRAEQHLVGFTLVRIGKAIQQVGRIPATRSNRNPTTAFEKIAVELIYAGWRESQRSNGRE